jgi:hypothetical protein
MVASLCSRQGHATHRQTRTLEDASASHIVESQLSAIKRDDNKGQQSTKPPTLTHFATSSRLHANRGKKRAPLQVVMLIHVIPTLLQILDSSTPTTMMRPATSTTTASGYAQGRRNGECEKSERRASAARRGGGEDVRRRCEEKRWMSKGTEGG